MWEKEYQKAKLKKQLKRLPKESLKTNEEESSEQSSEVALDDRPRNILKLTEASRGRSKCSKIFIVTNRSVKG